jgi:hypothetical protein
VDFKNIGVIERDMNDLVQDRDYWRNLASAAVNLLVS